MPAAVLTGPEGKELGFLNVKEDSSLIYYKGSAYTRSGEFKCVSESSYRVCAVFRLVTSPIHVFKLDPKP